MLANVRMPHISKHWDTHISGRHEHSFLFELLHLFTDIFLHWNSSSGVPLHVLGHFTVCTLQSGIVSLALLLPVAHMQQNKSTPLQTKLTWTSQWFVDAFGNTPWSWWSHPDHLRVAFQSPCTEIRPPCSRRWAQTRDSSVSAGG